MPTPPSVPIITSFDDERNRFDYYWERLNALDIPSPATATFPLTETASGRLDWNTSAIRQFMSKNDMSRAFVRSQHKAATRRLVDGSYIQNSTEEEIDRTVESLLTQHEQDGWPHGGSIVVRDWIDLQFCMHHSHDLCHPEIRYFIEDGDILASSPVSLSDTSFVCADQYEYLNDTLATIDEQVPRTYAQQVADEFTEATWAIDFVMDTTGTWYCPELNLNGIYWHEKTSSWNNMCGHGELEAFSPLFTHSAALSNHRPTRPNK